MTERVLVAWSGGKDSSLALHKIKESERYAVAGLLTTVTEDCERVSMHGVRLHLLKKQAARLGYPLDVVFIPRECNNEDYAGREYDRKLLKDLPESVDPCGENGEFHTFVYDGPIFKKGIDMSVGRVVLRDNRFYFCDFLEKGMVECG